MKHFKLTRIFSLLCVFTLVFTSYAVAQVIDFETIPGVGTPTTCLEINTQYQSSYGITFNLEGGGSPVIAKVGSPLEAFVGPGSGDDNPADGQNIGNYFLTDDCVLSGSTSPPLIVSYDPPTAEASGVILDIDANETFTIQARDASDMILETITIAYPDPGTGDGIATPWSFDRSSADIYSIRFQGTKTTGGFGLGFDNFSARSAEPTPPPTPTAPTQVPTMTEWGMIIFMFLAGLGAIYYLRKQRRVEK